jgi:hypothetical protein
MKNEFIIQGDQKVSIHVMITVKKLNVFEYFTHD